MTICPVKRAVLSRKPTFIVALMPLIRLTVCPVVRPYFWTSIPSRGATVSLRGVPYPLLGVLFPS